MTKEWLGNRVCNFCGKGNLESLVDGKTRYGMWGVMCDDCFIKWGKGYGIGKGQRYVLDKEGKMVKIVG